MAAIALKQEILRNMKTYRWFDRSAVVAIFGLEASLVTRASETSHIKTRDGLRGWTTRRDAGSSEQTGRNDAPRSGEAP